MFGIVGLSEYHGKKSFASIPTTLPPLPLRTTLMSGTRAFEKKLRTCPSPAFFATKKHPTLFTPNGKRAWLRLWKRVRRTAEAAGLRRHELTLAVVAVAAIFARGV